MKRVIAIVACGLSVAACSSTPSWMPDLSLPKPSGGSTTVQLESDPPGAEARTSAGQTCRTPCALAVPESDFTVTFSMPGFQPQSVPVRLVVSSDAPDVALEAPTPQPPRLVPNPVYAELRPAPPPAVKKKPAPPPKKRPKPTPKPAPAAAAPAPAPAPAAAWPPPPAR
jgi:hypothetical protein